MKIEWPQGIFRCWITTSDYALELSLWKVVFHTNHWTVVFLWIHDRPTRGNGGVKESRRWIDWIQKVPTTKTELIDCFDMSKIQNINSSYIRFIYSKVFCEIVWHSQNQLDTYSIVRFERLQTTFQLTVNSCIHKYTTKTLTTSCSIWETFKH